MQKVTIDFQSFSDSSSEEEGYLHLDRHGEEAAPQDQDQGQEPYTPTTYKQSTLLGGVTKKAPRVRVSWRTGHSRKWPRPRKHRRMDELSPDFNYVSLSLWAKSPRVPRGTPKYDGLGMWWDPIIIDSE